MRPLPLPSERPPTEGVGRGASPGAARNVHLDAIRAAAILIVMFHHARTVPGVPAWLAKLSIRGYVGVDLFFVLSGWLIGGQVLRAAERTGRVDVLRFWGRRWLRTLPAYYAVLLVIWAFGNRVRHPFSMFLFLQNYTAPTEWIITWSLCVEEHFYLALPLVLWATRRRRSLALGALALFAASPVALRGLAFDGMMRGTFEEYEATFFVPTHLRLDGLVLGVALAAAKEHAPALWGWCTRNAVALAAAGVALLVAFAYDPWAYAWTETDRMALFAAVPGFFGVSLGAALLIPAAVSLPPFGGWPARATTWVAEHAYTLYLVHCFAFNAALDRITRRPALVLPVMFGAAFAAAWVLRTAVEKPGLRLRDALMARRRAPALTAAS